MATNQNYWKKPLTDVELAVEAQLAAIAEITEDQVENSNRKKFQKIKLK